MKLPETLYAFVIDQELRTARTGSFFWQTNLKTPEGEMKAMIWNAHERADTSPTFPHVGDIIAITALDDKRDTKGSITIKGFNRITINDVPKEIRDAFYAPAASPEDMKKAWMSITNIDMWRMKKHYHFTMDCLNRLDQEKLFKCPAASRIHHNYQGGLIIHTAEVLRLCLSVVDAMKEYDFVDRDVLISGAILHDMGKVKSYGLNEFNMAQMLPTERSVGHLFYGMQLVGLASAGKFKVSQEFVDEVLHCIASHHGEHQYGSIKPCLSIESGILSKMDYISSRNGKVQSKLKSIANSKQTMRDQLDIYGDKYFASIAMKKYVEGERAE
jgi:3'-5' exoribonuclease